MSEREELDGMAAYYHAIRNPSRDDPNWPLPSFDAKDWAQEFCRLFPGSDEGLMLGWFANALMRGYDEATIRLRAELVAARDALRVAHHDLTVTHNCLATNIVDIGEAQTFPATKSWWIDNSKEMDAIDRALKGPKP